jgi:ABC-type branched-subunit amino acid transport system substrate-binding protein
MKNRMLKSVVFILLGLTLVLTSVLVGCAKPVATKTLDIGVVSNLQSGPGLQLYRSTQVLADLDNQAGGLLIGGERYNVHIISYDNSNSQATAAAAVNKLVFEDKVKFIFFDAMSYDPAWLPITEANKVVVEDMIFTGENLDPNYHYCYNPSGYNALSSVAVGWYCKNYPDNIKNFICVAADNMMGHHTETTTAPLFAAFGGKYTVIYSPENTQDFSSVATKVKSLNPTAYVCQASDPMAEGVMYKAMWDAGCMSSAKMGQNRPLGKWTL